MNLQKQSPHLTELGYCEFKKKKKIPEHRDSEHEFIGKNLILKSTCTIGCYTRRM